MRRSVARATTQEQFWYTFPRTTQNRRKFSLDRTVTWRRNSFWLGHYTMSESGPWGNAATVQQ